MRSKFYLFQSSKIKNFCKAQLLTLIAVAGILLGSSSAYAQTYYGVSNLSGTSTEGGINVTVTSTGAVNTYLCGGYASPYWTGEGAIGSYTWSFSSPVGSVAMHIDAQDPGDDCSFMINGVAYSINASQLSSFTPTCFGSITGSAIGGDLVAAGGGDAATYLVITPGFAINSFTIVCQGASDGITNDFNFAVVTDNAPTFVHGSPQGFTLCENAPAYDISSLLAVNDADAGQTETWTVASSTPNGIVSAGYITTSTGGTLTPTGLTYQPATGFSGLDSFTVQVNDGAGGTASTTIYVTVNALPSAAYTAPGPICLGNIATFVSGAPLCSGEALNFNGTTSGATGSLPTTATANVTLEAWVKWDGGGSGNQMIVLNGNSSTSGYGLFQNSGTLTVVAGGASTMTSSYTLTPGVWTHVAAVADGSDNWTLYVNGVPNVLSPSTGNPNTPAGTFSVGTDQAGIETFSGVIDEVKVWTTARTNTQVTADMLACNTSPQAGLAGYWKFDEGTGTTTADASGNSHTLTLTNTTWVAATELLSTYAWNFGDGTPVSMLNNVAHTYTATGVYSTSLVVTSAQGCTASSTGNVVVNPNPNAITGMTTVCTGLTTTLNATPVGGTWSSNNTALGSVDAATGVVTGTAAGTPIISYALITGCYVTTSVTVNQTPSLSTPLTSAICDNTVFHYVPASATAGTTYTWSRAAVTGVSQGAANGIDSMNETLTDTTAFQVVVTYKDTLKNTNGCMNIQAVTVTVNPNPTLSSVLSATPVCDSVLFTYLPVSLTPGTSFYWTRDTVAGITNGSNFGPDNVSETLVNSSTAPVTVNYQYILYANSCTDTQTVSVVVNPKPILTSSLTPPTICDNTLFTYASTSATNNISYSWSRAMVYGISNAAASGVDTVMEVLNDTTNLPVAVVYVDTLSANGCTNYQYVTVTVNPLPTLTSTLTPAAICDSTLFSYAFAGSVAGTTYSWSRAAIAGISNTAASGIDSISEVLTDTSANPVSVVYVDTLTAYGCSNTENITVIVNPKPMLSSPLTQGLCDSLRFDYTPTSATTGTAFTWTRAYVLGIDLVAGSGVNDPYEFIRNNTNDNLPVVYVYTLTANGCSNTQNVTVVSHPTPTLSSNLTPTVCSGSDFSYIPTGYVFGTTFEWRRNIVAGLYPATDTGSTVINETLTDSTFAAINTVYYFTLTANGCVHTENVTLTVLPKPDVPQITTYPPSALCSNTMYQNFGTSMTQPAGMEYTWVAQNATVWATGQGRQYCLVNFNTPGTAVVTLQTNLSGIGCTTDNSYTVTVGSSVSDNPQIIYFDNQLICLVDNEDTYQWGYDDATTLDSTLLVGEIRPNYIISALDQDHRYYWVITTKDGCMQKSYFNTPTAITNVNAADGTDVKVYPNPANSIVNVEISTTAEGSYRAEIVNILGQKISSTDVQNHKATFEVQSLPAGCYLIDCYRDGAKISATRFIKN